jgi:hypothetical protein
MDDFEYAQLNHSSLISAHITNGSNGPNEGILPKYLREDKTPKIKIPDYILHNYWVISFEHVLV